MAGFKDWVMKCELEADENNNLDENMQLEESIDKERKSKEPRKSPRISDQKKYKQTINAYNAYLESIEQQLKLL